MLARLHDAGPGKARAPNLGEGAPELLTASGGWHETRSPRCCRTRLSWFQGLPGVRLGKVLPCVPVERESQPHWK